jgi:mannose-1-phosphate guanylyltransferase/mannose-6-phosphate isomerase
MVTVPVILAGGIGERFWPMSRSSCPKQLLKLVSSKTMVEETLDRLAPLCKKGRVKPLIITGKQIAAQMAKVLAGKAEYDIIVEPEGKNTAPAILLAADWIEQKYGPAVMLIVSADHDIRPRSAYISAVKTAVDYASKNDALVVFGIKPTRPECGYGYLHLGKKLGESAHAAVHTVQAFVEKPSPEKARKFVKQKSYLWNSGMFVWRTSVILDEFAALQPALYANVVPARVKKFSKIAIDTFYRACEKISIDYGIMEHSSKVAAVVGNFSWDDIGSWESVGRVQGSDAAGLTKVGANIEAFDCSNTLVFNNTSMTCAAIGLSDLAVVVTGDALLVVHRSKLDEFKKYLAIIKNNPALPKTLF